MTLLKLKGKSKFGLSKINEARTNIWEVVKTKDTVTFDPSGGSKWVLVTPKGQSAFHSCSSWVHIPNDENFEVINYD